MEGTIDEIHQFIINRIIVMLEVFDRRFGFSWNKEFNRGGMISIKLTERKRLYCNSEERDVVKRELRTSPAQCVGQFGRSVREWDSTKSRNTSMYASIGASGRKSKPTGMRNQWRLLVPTQDYPCGLLVCS